MHHGRAVVKEKERGINMLSYRVSTRFKVFQGHTLSYFHLISQTVYEVHIV